MRRRGFLRLTAACCLFAGCGKATDAARYAPEEAQRLTVYTSHKQTVYEPLVREFEARTGIWVQLVTAGTTELLEQIAAESKAPRCDVMVGGGAESLLEYADYFEPYPGSLSESIKPSLRAPGDLWVPFSELPLVLVYNPKLVGAGALSGWRDLLQEQWRGRIAFADPAVSGSSYTALMTMLSCVKGDFWQNLEAFYENLNGQLLEDSGDVIPAVRAGRFPVGVCLEEAALRQYEQTRDITILYPAEGTSCLPDGAAFMKNAKHPENAVLFLDFLQGEDAQTLVAQSLYRRSIRLDVPVPPELPDEKEMGVLQYDIAAAAAQKEAVLARWEELKKGALL